MKTVDIKGKEYVMVNERIKFFRENYPDYSLVSDIISMEDGTVTMKASVITPDNRVIATGHAQEKETNGFINKFSYIENCETSAWGRCLANMGIGVDASVASADEVANAIKNQTKHVDDRDFTDDLRNAVTVNDIVAIWNTMTESEKAKFKGLASSMKQKIKEENPESMIKSMRKEGKTRPMIEELIQNTKDKEYKKTLIELYNTKLQSLGIDEQYEFTPFEEKV